jgi:predicted acylesterase/phospholipase RssA
MVSTIRILSIDGGGIRGIIAATVLRELLRGQGAQDVFHLIAGTSTGGILACGLCRPTPLSPDDLVNLYVEHGREIFPRSFPGASLLGPRYSAKTLEMHLRRQLGDIRLADVQGVDLLVPSYAIELPKPRPDGETRAPLFFRSWQAAGEDLPPGASATEYDFLLRDVARATSSAPTYFEPAAIQNTAGERFGMIDGGVFANNPAMCALVAAWRRYGHQHQFIVVSLGNGFLQRPIPLVRAKSWGKIGWLEPILSVLMDGTSDTVTFQTQEVLGANHHRFDIPLGVTKNDHHAVNDDFDDASASNISALLAKANDLIELQHSRLDEVARLLRTPRDDPKLPSAPVS